MSSTGIQRKDGEWIWVSSRAWRTYEIGGVRCADGVVSDITKHKRAEEALRKSEDLYRLLFTQMSAGCALVEIIYDHQGVPCDYRHVDVNPTFEKHTGLARERIVEKTIREVLPDIEPFWIETYGKVAATGASTRFESYAEPLRKWFEVSAFRVGPHQVGVTFANITERKCAEAELARERTLLRTLIDNVPDYVYVKDADSKIIINNVAHQQLLGAGSEEDARGKTDFDFFPAPLARQYFDDEQSIMASGRPMMTREETTVGRDGLVRWL